MLLYAMYKPFYEYVHMHMYIYSLYIASIYAPVYTHLCGGVALSVWKSVCVCVSAYLAVHMQNVCTNNQFVSRCECICKWLYKYESEKERELVYHVCICSFYQDKSCTLYLLFFKFLSNFFIFCFQFLVFLLLNNFVGVSSFACFSFCFLFCLAFHIYLVTVSQAQFWKTLK